MSIRNLNQGMTLIEILIVISIISVLSGLSLFMSMESFRGYSFRDERNEIISNLQKTRSRAINNICLGAICNDGKYHGVHFESDKYTIFQGVSWADRDVAMDEVNHINKSMNVVGITDVIFSQLSGDATTTPPLAWNINISDISTNSSAITINSEGLISWTN